MVFNLMLTLNSIFEKHQMGERLLIVTENLTSR
jgi:hypothetical protein